MAIYEATKHNNSEEFRLKCPISGRCTNVSGSVKVSGGSFGTHEEDDSWMPSHHTGLLSVIREDAETIPDASSTGASSPPNKETSPHASRAGSFRSGSQIGSMASGIHANIPPGSR